MILAWSMPELFNYRPKGAVINDVKGDVARRKDVDIESYICRQTIDIRDAIGNAEF